MRYLINYGILLTFLTSLYSCGQIGTVKQPAPSPTPLPSGPPGPPGPQGPQGVIGATGVANVFTTTSDPGACPNGGTVLLIAQDTANTGVWEPSDKNQTSVLICNGTNGTNGKPGANASLTMVQFCPSYTTTYPSDFPEFGICVNNALYAVYWDGRNSWLSELVPGVYASTSTSAPCTFSVNANCLISH